MRVSYKGTHQNRIAESAFMRKRAQGTPPTQIPEEEAWEMVDIIWKAPDFVVIFSSLTGFLGHMSLSGVDYSLLGWTAAGSAAGAVVGSRLMTDKLQGRQVKAIIGLVLIAIACRMAWGLL
ncbi:MAG: TSUP family transporter [Acidobacteriota bacterium]